MDKTTVIKMRNILIICLLSIINTTIFAQNTQIIAHRGFWDKPHSSQNSITALKIAQFVPIIYGSEFDVNMTADGVMIVSHGPKLGSIEDVQKASYKEVKKVRLKNGEKVPTLKQYLKQGKKGDIKLIFELKVHPAGEKENLAVKKSVEMVRKMNLQDKVEFISFSLEACKQFAQQMPECPVQYLNGKIPPAQLKEMGIMGLDYHYTQIQKNPQWIKEAHDLGMTVNVWTVNKKEIIKEMVDLNVDFITTDAPVTVFEMLK